MPPVVIYALDFDCLSGLDGAPGDLGPRMSLHSAGIGKRLSRFGL